MSFTIPNAADASHQDIAEPDSGDFEILSRGYAASGVISGCAVTAQGTPDMTVAVAAGEVIVAGTRATVASGNVTITAANAVLARFDLVVVDNAGAKTAIAGTAAANPVFPAITAGRAVLAAVHVPALDTTIGANQITDKRVLISVPQTLVQADGWEGFGFGGTLAAFSPNGGSLAMVADRSYFLRWFGRQTISKIGIEVGVAAGNIWVGIARNTGAGSAAVPDVRAGTSGSIATPAAGYQEIALGGSITVNHLDWAFIGSSSATTAVRGHGGSITATAFGNGISMYKSASNPPADPVGAMTSGHIGAQFALRGVT